MAASALQSRFWRCRALHVWRCCCFQAARWHCSLHEHTRVFTNSVLLKHATGIQMGVHTNRSFGLVHCAYLQHRCQSHLHTYLSNSVVSSHQHRYKQYLWCLASNLAKQDLILHRGPCCSRHDKHGAVRLWMSLSMQPFAKELR